MSWPNGGTPPAAICVKLLGTKPSLNDAAPLFMPICDARGIGRMNGPAALAANGSGILVGVADWSICFPQKETTVAETPVGFGKAPDCATIASSTCVSTKLNV